MKERSSGLRLRSNIHVSFFIWKNIRSGIFTPSRQGSCWFSLELLWYEKIKWTIRVYMSESKKRSAIIIIKPALIENCILDTCWMELYKFEILARDSSASSHGHTIPSARVSRCAGEISSSVTTSCKDLQFKFTFYKKKQRTYLSFQSLLWNISRRRLQITFDFSFEKYIYIYKDSLRTFSRILLLFVTYFYH